MVSNTTRTETQEIYLGSLKLSNPFLLAPMAGLTNLPARLMAKAQGAGLVYTEMVSAAGLCQGAAKTRKLMISTDEERPVGVQLFGAKPEWMARAARLAQEAGADLIDINMGCSVRKVVKHGAGAALLKDFKLIEEMLQKTRKAVDIPLTIKTRLGWTKGVGEVMDLVPILVDAGIDGMTLHGRWASQGFTGNADWDAIKRLVEVFPGPVIGNGDVTGPVEAVNMLEQTGAFAVMIGRAAVGNPWIFSQCLDYYSGREVKTVSHKERFNAAYAHSKALKELVGSEHAVFMLRSVLMSYTKGLRNSAEFRGRINRNTDFDSLLLMLKQYFNDLPHEEKESKTP